VTLPLLHLFDYNTLLSKIQIPRALSQIPLIIIVQLFDLQTKCSVVERQKKVPRKHSVEAF
jgi:hypothetical protein